MIARIVALEVAGADPALYDALLGRGHTAGGMRVELGARTRAVLAADEPAKELSRLERRGIEVRPATDPGSDPAGEGDVVVVNGLELALVDGASRPVPNPDVVLDHLVIRTADAERAIANYGGRLGIELRLERHAPQWGMHMLFFRCGDAILEIVQPLGDEPHTGADLLWGVTWRVPDLETTMARLRAAGIEIGEIRQGRKRGTQVCTVGDRRAGIRTLLIQQESLPFSNS